MVGRALMVALAIGTVLQVAMTVFGHYDPPVRAMFAFGGVGFSLVAGAIFARSARSGWSDNPARRSDCWRCVRADWHRC